MSGAAQRSAPAGADEGPDLAALLASRICHDLVSPVGAITNGIELLEMAEPGGEEIALVRSSAEAAAARLRLFRLTFGAADRSQTIAPRDVLSLMEAVWKDTRLEVRWTDGETWPRPELRLALLSLMCVESAMPWGGRIEVGRNAAAWVLHAEAERMRIDHALWECLETRRMPPDLRGAEVQFGILLTETIRLDRPVAVTADDRRLSLTV